MEEYGPYRKVGSFNNVRGNQVNNPYGFDKTDAQRDFESVIERSLSNIGNGHLGILSGNARSISDVLTAATESVEEEAGPLDRLGRDIKPGDVIVYGDGNLGVVVSVKQTKVGRGNDGFQLRVAKAPRNLRRPDSYYVKPGHVWVKDLSRVFVQAVKPKEIGLAVTPTVEVNYA